MDELPFNEEFPLCLRDLVTHINEVENLETRMALRLVKGLLYEIYQELKGQRGVAQGISHGVYHELKGQHEK